MVLAGKTVLLHLVSSWYSDHHNLTHPGMLLLVATLEGAVPPPQVTNCLLCPTNDRSWLCN